jgi:hypothetical protein
VSEPAANPIPYRVLPSTRVVHELQSLMRRAIAAGRGSQSLAALKEMQHRLSMYPQFGENLKGLRQTRETLWIGTIPPLVVQYVIDDVIRAVFIGIPIKALPNAGFE